MVADDQLPPVIPEKRTPCAYEMGLTENSEDGHCEYNGHGPCSGPYTTMALMRLPSGTETKEILVCDHQEMPSYFEPVTFHQIEPDEVIQLLPDKQ